MLDEDYISEVDGYGYDGEGVTRFEGKVVFIPYALKGEKVRYKIKKSLSSFSYGKLCEVIIPSDKRAVPPCQYYGRCGGCSYQHTTYENELDIKESLLQRELKKVGYNGEIIVFKSEHEYGYRNKIRLFVGYEGLSLRERKSHKLCPINNCLLISGEMNRAIEAINRFLKAQNLFSRYSEIVIREEGDKHCLVFYCDEESEVNYQGLYLILGSNYGIFECVNDKLIHKIGIKELEVKEFGLTCKFSPTSFHQVNRYVGSELYKYVVENVKGDSCINCYSGAGVLSGYISSFKKRTIGIELGRSEHQDAEMLKEENNLFYLTNLQGDCGEVLPKLEEGDTIIVDPPKAGVDMSVINAINDFNAQRLIYISCNCATLVRDISRLVGYKLTSVRLYDMFARTGEYEVIALLDRL